MRPLRWRGSLRGRLTMACSIVMLLSAVILLFGNLNILQRTLAQQAQYQTAQVTSLLDQSIAAPLAQRDYAVLQQTLDRVIDLDSITYIVLFDHRGRRVVGAGWDAAKPMPARDSGDIDLQASGAMRHLSSKVTLEGQTLGTVSFGVSIAGLRAAQAAFERQALLIAAFTLVLSFGLVTALASALTRHLSRLELSSRKIAAGNFDINVPVSSHDEVGRLALSFNAMALALRDRIDALRFSEALQTRHLQDARDGQAKLEALVEAIPAGIVFVDESGTILHANRSFMEMWRLPADPAGTAIIELMPRLRNETAPKDVPALEYLLHGPMPEKPVPDIEFSASDGRLISQQVRAVHRDQASGGYMCLHKDVTRERSTEQQAQLALRDPLTKLFNRRGLFDALQSATMRADETGQPVLLMFIDLDDFKHANDIGGHRMGDEILVTIAATLVELLRDGNVVARLGGDEFAIICPGAQLDAGAAIAARVVEAISNLRFATEHTILHVGCSIGLAQYPIDAHGADELIACADAAMYEAKQRGKNGWFAFQSSSTRIRTNGSRIDWNGGNHQALP